MKVQIDFSKRIKKMAKLNGMNNGPLTAFFDHTEDYREMGVDHVRFHETHSYNTKCVEIPFIFRDFDADETDPKNYYFKETDAVIRAAVDAGIQIVYRLGMGTEGTRPFLFMAQPKDHAKWARICEHVVMHYNEGWADGFHYNIEYWEIWNEADSPNYWTGDRMDYVKLYETAWNYLKKRFPHLKFGSTGFANVRGRKPDNPDKIPEWESRWRMTDAFAALIASGKADMDFFAFHSYHRDIAGCRYRLMRTLSLLEDFGLKGYELINTEWNAVDLRLIPNKTDSKFALRRGSWKMEQLYTMHCAVDVLATMLIYQKAGISAADYYDAEERSKFCGLYDFDGTKKLHFYSMKAFKWLRDGEYEVECDGFETDTTAALASGNGKNACACFCNDGEKTTATLEIKGLKNCPYTVYAFDETHRLEPVRKGNFTGSSLRIALGKDTAAFIKFEL